MAKLPTNRLSITGGIIRNLNNLRQTSRTLSASPYKYGAGVRRLGEYNKFNQRRIYSKC